MSGAPDQKMSYVDEAVLGGGAFHWAFDAVGTEDPGPPVMTPVAQHRVPTPQHRQPYPSYGPATPAHVAQVRHQGSHHSALMRPNSRYSSGFPTALTGVSVSSQQPTRTMSSSHSHHVPHQVGHAQHHSQPGQHHSSHHPEHHHQGQQVAHASHHSHQVHQAHQSQQHVQHAPHPVHPTLPLHTHHGTHPTHHAPHPVHAQQHPPVMQSLPLQARGHPMPVSSTQGQSSTCQYCGKSYSRPDYLSTHIAGKHSGRKMWNCKVCGKEYKWRSSLSHHQKTAHQRADGMHSSSVNSGARIPKRDPYAPQR